MYRFIRLRYNFLLSNQSCLLPSLCCKNLPSKSNLKKIVEVKVVEFFASNIHNIRKKVLYRFGENVF